ncbi:DUF6069 family protein [Catenuloplanes indicus]|uniref:Uncharacterized protein n=1 Tax=Catenuloplanes indicus TaxID=137267 RepID=A0AAE3W7F0_9ACTN|nr:DUF6069 family protein [Catenuloplanes indicus]MDQ0369805.1 hypothetical protein [Catenuloplanes indicus]
MRTLTLRAGARVPVVAAEWHDAFAVVTRGRVRLELRDGTPGPLLGRDAAFWLRGTGVRALRNPGRRTATLRVITLRRTGMTSMNTARPAWRRLAGTGLAATFAAAVATTLAAALARAAGVGLDIDGEAIPLPGFALVTGVCSLAGVVIAAALRRWSVRPAARFVRITTALTAISLIPPFLVGADTATVAALVALHLIPAAVMIPALARTLRTG